MCYLATLIFWPDVVPQHMLSFCPLLALSSQDTFTICAMVKPWISRGMVIPPLFMDLKHTENKHVTSFFRDDRPAVRYQLIIHMLIGDSSNSYPRGYPIESPRYLLNSYEIQLTIPPIFHLPWFVVFRHPSEKCWSESQLGWWHDIPNCFWKVITAMLFMFQTTNQW